MSVLYLYETNTMRALFYLHKNFAYRC